MGTYESTGKRTQGWIASQLTRAMNQQDGAGHQDIEKRVMSPDPGNTAGWREECEAREQAPGYAVGNKAPTRPGKGAQDEDLRSQEWNSDTRWMAVAPKIEQ